MINKVFLVPNISCEHCTRTIESELSEIKGVKEVTADQSTKQVTVDYDAPATWEQIVTTLQDINYPPSNQVVFE